MKKILVICVCIITAFALSACGGTKEAKKDMTPTETVQVFLDAFKADDEETLDQVYAGEGDDFMSAYEMDDSDEDKEDGEEAGDEDVMEVLQKELSAKWHDFDYEITGEEISEDGNTATVNMTITTYDMTKVFNNFYQEFMGQALEQFSGNANNITEDQYNEMAMNILQEELAKVTEKDYTGDASLTLTKTDGQWIIDEITEKNNDFLNAITGGLMDVLTDVVNTLGEQNGD